MFTDDMAYFKVQSSTVSNHVYYCTTYVYNMTYTV